MFSLRALALPSLSSAPRQPVQFALWLACWAILATVVGVHPSARADANAELCISAHERAQVERLDKHYLAAREQLLVCAQRSCPQLISKDCGIALAELEATLPSVVFAVADEAGRDLLEARVFVNDTLVANHIDGHAIPLDPGVYSVRFEADGYAPEQQSLSVREGEKSRLVRGVLRSAASVAPASALPAATPDAAQPRDRRERRVRRLRIAGYSLAAATVASFAVTLGAGARGYRIFKNCEQDSCSDSYAERGQLLYRTVNVSAVTGGVLLTAASITLLSAWRQQAKLERAHRGLSGFADTRGAGVMLWQSW